MSRPRSLAALALTQFCVLAQTPDAWDKQVWQWRYLQLMYPGPTPGCFVVSDTPDAWLHVDFSRDKRLSAIVSEISVWPVAEQPRKALWARHGWGPDIRWAVIDPDLKVLEHGAGVLSTENLLVMLRRTGWRPVKERREDFLKEHPEAGSVLATQMLDLAISAMSRDPRNSLVEDPTTRSSNRLEPLPAKEEEALYGELATLFTSFLAVDGWQDCEELEMLCEVFGAPALRAVKLMEEPLKQLKRGLESELSRNPEHASVWSSWVLLLDEEDHKNSEAWVSAFDPAPGQVWPPAGYAKALSTPFRLRSDAVGLERLASRSLDQVMGIKPLGRNRRAQRQAIKEWTAIRFGALLKLERYAEARSLLESSRSALGSEWKQLIGEIGNPEKFPIPEAEQKAISKVLELEAEAEAPEPTARPLRLALLGEPEWSPLWSSLQAAKDFDDFSPADELSWAMLTAPEQQRIRLLGKVEVSTGWVLLDGDEVIAQGSTIPSAPALSSIIQSIRTPRLTALDAFIRSHPDRLDARNLRLETLRSRMPHPRLEARLLDDARLLSSSFHPSPEWKRSDARWETEAKRVLPMLEDRLRRWPDSLDAWRLWLDWSEVHPGNPAPGRLINFLPSWRPHPLPGRAQVPLPMPVFKLVAERLKARGAWPALSDWCKAFWESGIRERVSLIVRTAGEMPDNRRPRWEAMLREQVRTCVVPYQEALGAAQRTLELSRLNAELEVIRPGLSRRP